MSPTGQIAPSRLSRRTLASPSLFNPLLLLACLLVLNHLGRPFEFFLTGLRIPLVLCAVAAVAVFASGAIRAAQTPIGISLIAFVIWLLATVPFSTWRGGSASYAFYYAGLWPVLFMISAAAPKTMKDIRRVGNTVMIASVGYILLGSKITSGRLAGQGTFGNSDDIAIIGGFVLPFIVLFASRLKNIAARALVIAFGAGLMLYAIGLTATRTALLGLAAMIVVYLVRGTGVQRLAIFVACVAGLVGMLVSLPRATLERFSTIFEALDEHALEAGGHMSEATASTLGRKELWRDAIATTLEHPITGIGPGQFVEYRFHHYLNPDGTTKGYLPTHNTYLEISSEEGVLGLLIYLAFLGLIYGRIRKCVQLNAPNSYPEWAEGRQIAVCLEASFVYFLVCTFFMTCERHPQQFLIAGLALALERITVMLKGQGVPVASNRRIVPTNTALTPQAAAFRTATGDLSSRALYRA